MISEAQRQWDLAHQLVERGHWVDARVAFLELLRVRPGHVPALLQLSYIESLHGSYCKARDFVLQALHAAPWSDKATAELIARLRTFNEIDAIDTCARRLPRLSDVDIRLLLSFAAQFSYLNQQTRAMQFLDEAKRGDPDFPPTLAARGQVLTYLGRFEEAEEDLQHCINRAPQLAQAHWLLSRLKKVTSATHHVDQIRSSLRKFGHGGDAVALLEYALHKELDDLGDHEGAWSALQRACSAKRATLRYSTDQTRELFAALRMVRGGRKLDGERELDRPTPIFIVGMHRSGTTLLERLLSRHQGIRTFGELYDFTSQMRLATDHHCPGVIDSVIVDRARPSMMSAVGDGYMRSTEWRLEGARHFTDKLPSNFLNLGFICQALPDARILHMVRDPMEVGFSNLRELFSGANPYSYDQQELADYYLQYRALMDHWHEEFPGRILDVEYAGLTRSTDESLRRIATFCGVRPDFTGAPSEGVATASAVQVRERVETRPVPKWYPYAEQLRVFQERLSLSAYPLRA